LPVAASRRLRRTALTPSARHADRRGSCRGPASWRQQACGRARARAAAVRSRSRPAQRPPRGVSLSCLIAAWLVRPFVRDWACLIEGQRRRAPSRSCARNSHFRVHSSRKTRKSERDPRSRWTRISAAPNSRLRRRSRPARIGARCEAMSIVGERQANANALALRGSAQRHRNALLFLTKEALRTSTTRLPRIADHRPIFGLLFGAELLDRYRD
jgi:hypothetical protein